MGVAGAGHQHKSIGEGERAHNVLQCVCVYVCVPREFVASLQDWLRESGTRSCNESRLLYCNENCQRNWTPSNSLSLTLVRSLKPTRDNFTHLLCISFTGFFYLLIRWGGAITLPMPIRLSCHCTLRHSHDQLVAWWLNIVLYTFGSVCREFHFADYSVFFMTWLWIKWWFWRRMCNKLVANESVPLARLELGLVLCWHTHMLQTDRVLMGSITLFDLIVWKGGGGGQCIATWVDGCCGSNEALLLENRRVLLGKLVMATGAGQDHCKAATEWWGTSERDARGGEKKNWTALSSRMACCFIMIFIENPCAVHKIKWWLRQIWMQKNELMGGRCECSSSWGVETARHSFLWQLSLAHCTLQLYGATSSWPPSLRSG